MSVELSSSIILYIGDILSNISLTIGCVLLISYLRKVPPDLSINRRLILSLLLPSIGAFVQRLFAHSIAGSDPEKWPNVDGSIVACLNALFLKDEYRDALDPNCIKVAVLAVITTFGAAAFICFGALIIMKISSPKHLIPMFGFQLAGLVFRVLMAPACRALFEFLVTKKSNMYKFFCGWCNAFSYGIFMLVTIIFYIMLSQKKFNDFWTAKSNLWKYVSLLFAFVFAFFMSIFICSGEPISTLITVSLIFIFILIVVPWRSYKFIRKNIQDINIEKEIAADVENFNKSRAQVKFNHDLPGHLQMIEELAIKENAPETAKLTHTLLDKCLASRKGFLTGNSFLDMVLYKMKETADKDSINLSFEGVFPENGIDNLDIGTIMTNALNNSIEACREVKEPREICISSGKFGDYVHVKITNPYKRLNIGKDGELLSTKSDGSIHGVGLQNIEEAVQLYDGSLSKTYDDGIFMLSFKLKYK